MIDESPKLNCSKCYMGISATTVPPNHPKTSQNDMFTTETTSLGGNAFDGYPIPYMLCFLIVCGPGVSCLPTSVDA